MRGLRKESIQIMMHKKESIQIMMHQKESIQIMMHQKESIQIMMHQKESIRYGGTVLYCTVQCLDFKRIEYRVQCMMSTLQYRTVPYYTVPYSTIRYSTIRPRYSLEVQPVYCLVDN